MKFEAPKKWQPRGKFSRIAQILFLTLLLTSCLVESAKTGNKLKNSPPMRSQGNISYLQQPAPAADSDDNNGSIMDGQDIVIDPNMNAGPQNENPQNLRATVDAGDDEVDDRMNNMINMQNAPTDPDDIVTAPATTNGDPIAGGEDEDMTITFTTTTTTRQVEQGRNNYFIEDFDSSVKHAVYPTPETDRMISWGVLLVGSFLLLIAFLKMFLNIVRSSTFFSMRQYKMKAMYSLLRDLGIFVLVLCVVLMLHFHSWLDFFHTNVENVLYGIYIFTSIWIVSSFFMFYTCYVRLETFYNYEALSGDQQKLNDLKNVFENNLLNNENISSSIRSNLNFQIMRQAFICPVELPILTECFLKRDFNFCMYLGYCITDFLSEIIGFINFKFYFFVATLLGSYRLIETLNIEPGSGVIYSIPVICFLVLFISKWNLDTVFFYLVPQINNEEEFDFQVDLDIIDPNDHEDKIPIPLYLRYGFEHQEDDHLDNINDDISRESIFENRREEERKYGWMFKSGKKTFGHNQNRHERLFWFGKAGVEIQKFLIQGCYFVLILWMSGVIAADGYDRFYPFDNQWVDIPIMIFTILLATFLILYYFPSAMFSYVLATSIQMMKKREYIELVIKEQKYEKALRSMRMYQVFKYIRRELIEGFNEDIEDREILKNPKKLIDENYSILQVDHDGEQQLPIEEVDTFAHLNGIKLKKLESFLFMAKADNGDEDYLNYNAMDDAAKQISNDVKVDPYDVISRIFYLLANIEYKVSIEQLDEFFEKYESYFEKRDIVEFKREIAALQRDGGQVDIQEIASLIRDDIECFPR